MLAQPHGSGVLTSATLRRVHVTPAGTRPGCSASPAKPGLGPRPAAKIPGLRIRQKVQPRRAPRRTTLDCCCPPPNRLSRRAKPLPARGLANRRIDAVSPLTRRLHKKSEGGVGLDPVGDVARVFDVSWWPGQPDRWSSGPRCCRPRRLLGLIAKPDQLPVTASSTEHRPRSALSQLWTRPPEQPAKGDTCAMRS